VIVAYTDAAALAGFAARTFFETYADANDPTQQRTLRKLEEDEKRAQVDYNWVQHRLTERLHVEGLSD